MPRKSSQPDDADMEQGIIIPNSHQQEQQGHSVDDLSRMLAAVLNYMSDDENEVIDVEFIIDNTDGLRDWWNEYKEKNRQLIEDEIKESLGELSIEELQRIRNQIKERQN
ncbi:hypothetical protein [Ureibacillus manganicus]|uniref:Uncharacterized protein n=1 Tax=Ureibacillus manganicus DSM 26584 TaxID=1384049 RepID=A0A0A3I3F6_9BACL|nr:hypothetical protein [Ureibacillus manganicus]KGR78040.1 hypothetical protein CD29_12865 [Ureibacillus manganicus DSM 26584]